MIVRISSMVVRIAGVLALLLGLLFWTNVVTPTGAVRNIHMSLGILVVLALWTLAFAYGRTRGANLGLAIGAGLLGLLVAYVGSAQETPPLASLGWGIQVIHLLLGLSAIGLGEVLAGGYKRLGARMA